MTPAGRIDLYKTGLMHRLLTNIAHGYHWYYSGTVGADRALAFLDHMELQFEPSANAKRREYRRRRHDRANAFLHLHPSYAAPAFHWWLMLTDGDHSPPIPPVTLGDARAAGRQRLIVPGDYETVVRPARGGVHRRTWQLTRPSYQAIVARIQESVRHRTDPRALPRILAEIHRYPAFRGVRSQVGSLRRLAVVEWRRIKPDTAQLVLPPFPPYVRFKRYPTAPIVVVRDRLLAGKRPFDWLELARPDLDAASAEGSSPPFWESDPINE